MEAVPEERGDVVKTRSRNKLASWIAKAREYRRAAAELKYELEQTRRELRVAVVERDENIAIRRALIELGVHHQTAHPSGEVWEMRYRINTETLKQVREGELERLAAMAARYLVEKMHRKWREKGVA